MLDYNNDRQIKLTQFNEINPIFLRANRFILEKYKEDLKDSPDEEKIEIIEKVWLAEFKASLIKSDKSSWEAIEFSNDQDKMMFLIKWGGKL